jgi:hypothetical protein
LGWLFPIYGKIKNIPNHQPEMDLNGTYSSTPRQRVSRHSATIGISLLVSWFVICAVGL